MIRIGAVLLIAIWILVVVLGSGTFKVWDWTAETWQAVAIGVTGWVLAVIAAKQAELEQARQYTQKAEKRTQEAEKEAITAEGLAIDISKITTDQPTIVWAETSNDYELSSIGIWEVLAFEREILDLNADYHIDTFGASRSGIYEFHIAIDFASWDQQASSYGFDLVAANRRYEWGFFVLSEQLPLIFAETVAMESGDTATFRVNQVGGRKRSVVEAGSVFRVRLLADL